MTGPLWIVGHLVDRGISTCLRQWIFPENFEIHKSWMFVSQFCPTICHLLIYCCNSSNFKNLFQLDETINRLKISPMAQPLIRHLKPRNQDEFDASVEIVNQFLVEVANSGIDPQSITTIFDLSSPAKSIIRPVSSSSLNPNNSFAAKQSKVFSSTKLVEATAVLQQSKAAAAVNEKLEEKERIYKSLFGNSANNSNFKGIKKAGVDNMMRTATATVLFCPSQQSTESSDIKVTFSSNGPSQTVKECVVEQINLQHQQICKTHQQQQQPRKATQQQAIRYHSNSSNGEQSNSSSSQM